VKLLVVNADDLGYDPEIDRGILEAHARGIVTSTTAMVETPFAAEALRRAPRSLGVGLHAIVDRIARRGAAETALRGQVARFADLRGELPTHLDSHKHVHAAAEILEAFAGIALELGLPVRSVDAATRGALRARAILTPDHFLGDAALRPAWTEEALVAALAGLEGGVTELMAHPGHAPRIARTSFGAARAVELAALCGDPARRALLDSGARLCTYAQAREALVRGGGSAERIP